MPGKIAAPLQEKLENVEWGEFRIGDLFEKIKTNNVINNNLGDLPATTAVLSNNQIGKYISRENATILKNVFSATANGFGKAFYQPKEFTVLQDSYAFRFKDEKVKTEKIHPFIIGALNKIYLKYDWGNKSGWTKVREEKILLPTKNGEIDFDFMENFIAELEAYLQATRLKNYVLTSQEEKVLREFESGGFESEEFNVIDIFNVKNTGNILSRDILEDSGKVPYLSASAKNNAISSYISYDEKYLDKGNCIFIGGKTFVISYQEKDFFSNDSHNLALYLKDEQKKTKLNQFFLAACINKCLKHRYSWGDSISNKKIQNDKILLPTKNNQPDYELRETLISAVQKLAIKGVVEYSERKVDVTKEIIKK